MSTPLYLDAHTTLPVPLVIPLFYLECHVLFVGAFVHLRWDVEVLYATSHTVEPCFYEHPI